MRKLRITINGPQGCGKTSLANRLRGVLARLGYGADFHESIVINPTTAGRYSWHSYVAVHGGTAELTSLIRGYVAAYVDAHPQMQPCYIVGMGPLACTDMDQTTRFIRNKLKAGWGWDKIDREVAARDWINGAGARIKGATAAEEAVNDQFQAARAEEKVAAAAAKQAEPAPRPAGPERIHKVFAFWDSLSGEGKFALLQRQAQHRFRQLQDRGRDILGVRASAMGNLIILETIEKDAPMDGIKCTGMSFDEAFKEAAGKTDGAEPVADKFVAMDLAAVHKKDEAKTAERFTPLEALMLIHFRCSPFKPYDGLDRVAVEDAMRRFLVAGWVKLHPTPQRVEWTGKCFMLTKLGEEILDRTLGWIK